MQLPFYIAKRVHFSTSNNKKISAPAVKIASIGVALGVAVMLITVGIATGFKNEIRNKIVGFGAHLRISNLDQNASFETSPIHFDSTFIQEIYRIKGIQHVQVYATKPGIIKNKGNIQGVVIKGVGNDYDWSFFKNNLLEGRVINTNTLEGRTEALISNSLSKMLNLKLGDAFSTCFFENDRLRIRKFTITGIYETNFIDFDKVFVITNIYQVQHLNMWDSTQVSGIEVNISDFSQLSALNDSVYNITANRFDDEGSSLLLRNVKELNPSIFGWLDLLDMNVWIILILMAAVAGFNMISGLLIIILEQTRMIGILKALGSSNWLIQKIFLAQSFFIIGKGMIWGNLLGLCFMFIQYHWKILTLNPENYYVSYVPINFNLAPILLINISTLVLTLLIMFIPSLLIRFITPSKAIKFE